MTTIDAKTKWIQVAIRFLMARDLIPPGRTTRVGGFGGTPLVVGPRWSFRGDGARCFAAHESVRSRRLRARLRTLPRGEQRGPDGSVYVSSSPPTSRGLDR